MAEKILIVDDDMDTLRLVGLMLQRQGYQIIAATNGQQGLTKAMEEHPDLILLDVMMPDIDGYEVTRRLRSDPATADVPILMFTAKAQLDDKVTGFEMGVDDYLTKPTHPTELQARIKALLSRRASDASKSASAEPSEQHAYVVGVLGARGGLGVSTLSMNLAAGFFVRTKSEVALADLVPGKGTLGLDLGMTNQKTLNKFLSGNPASVTRDRVKDALVPHISGVKLLLASDQPGDVHLISQVAQYEALVRQLVSLSRYLILDMGSGLLPFAEKILPLCGVCVVVLEGVPNTILHTKTLIGTLLAKGIKEERVLVVLNNRIRSDTVIPAAVVQEKLGHPITVTLTPAPELLTQAIRLQTAAILSQPDGMMARQFMKLVDTIIKQEDLV